MPHRRPLIVQILDTKAAAIAGSFLVWMFWSKVNATNFDWTEIKTGLEWLASMGGGGVGLYVIKRLFETPKDDKDEAKRIPREDDGSDDGSFLSIP